MIQIVFQGIVADGNWQQDCMSYCEDSCFSQCYFDGPQTHSQVYGTKMAYSAKPWQLPDVG